MRFWHLLIIIPLALMIKSLMLIWLLNLIFSLELNYSARNLGLSVLLLLIMGITSLMFHGAEKKNE